MPTNRNTNQCRKYQHCIAIQSNIFYEKIPVITQHQALYRYFPNAPYTTINSYTVKIWKWFKYLDSRAWCGRDLRKRMQFNYRKYLASDKRGGQGCNYYFYTQTNMEKRFSRSNGPGKLLVTQLRENRISIRSARLFYNGI